MNVNLSTNYLGLKLTSPLVPSSSPLTGDIDQLLRLQEAGAGAVVLPSLFEETIRHEEVEVAGLYDYQDHTYAESLSYFPELPDYKLGPDHYLFQLERAKKTLRIPVIASLNGSSLSGWSDYASQMQDAGADALELNIYFVPTDPNESPSQVEERYIELISAVEEKITLPIAVKIGPFFTNLAFTARRLVEAGADGLVLFNRYLEPDIDMEVPAVEPKLVLSNPHELRLPLRWLAILSALEMDGASLAATSGIHSAADAIKAIAAGAHVAMLASSLLQKGPAHLATILEEMATWLDEHEYTSVQQLTGSMNRSNSPNMSAFERANYAKALVSFSDRTI